MKVSSNYKRVALIIVLLLLTGMLAGCSEEPTTIPTITPRPTVTPTLKPSTTAESTTTRPTPRPTLPTPTAQPTITTSSRPQNLPWQPVKAGAAITRPDVKEQEKAMLSPYRSDVSLPENRTAPIYNIALKLETSEKEVSGTASQQLFYTNDTGSILFSLYLWLWANAPTDADYKAPLSISNVRVNGKSARSEITNGGAQLKIDLDGLKPGDTVAIELDFALNFPVENKYEYFKYDTANNIISLTFWYPQVAIYTQELFGWDNHPYNPVGDITNSRVSFFNLWLTAPTEQRVVANGTTLESKDNPDGTRSERIVTGPVRDLVATLSANYQVATAKAGDTVVTSYFVEQDRQWGEKAVQFAANSLKTYSEMFGTYPYAEFKVAEAPLVSFGGFEFPGMTIITSRYYDAAGQVSMEYAIAHEVGHQWWYGLVGNNQITSAWLDESLTQFCPIFYYERFKSKAEAQRILNSYMTSNFKAYINTGKDDIVQQTVYDFKTFGDYTFAVYNKGGLFYNAYRNTFGDEAFIRFAKLYLARNRYKIVGENDILEALKAGAGAEQEQAVVELFRHWFKAKEGVEDL